MFYITKGKEPEELSNFRRNIAISKKSYNWDDCPPQVKEKIKYSLAKEQNGLCAYCTRKIDEHCNIEHFYSRTSFPNKMFDYNNMLGVDNKNELAIAFKKKCEDGRGSKPLTINPLDQTIIKGIYYLSDGTIKHDLYQKDLDDVLHLNDPIFKGARANILKKIKSIKSQSDLYNYYIDFYKTQPYGGIVVYYLKKKMKDPTFYL